MFRTLVLLMTAGLLAILLAGSAAAQDWPSYPLSGNELPRGPGGYLSWAKLLCCCALYLAWVKTTDWVNKDCQLLKLPYAVWNAVVFFPFFASIFLFLLSLPLFLVGGPLALLCWIVPLGVYIVKRNSAVEPQERVLTPAHLRYLFAQQAQVIGVKIDAEKKAPHELGAPVEMMARSGESPRVDQANVIEARQSPGFIPTKELVATMVNRRADKVMLDFTQQSVAVRYQIDGVWHDDEALEREAGDAILAVLKTLAALNVKERRARQEGYFAAKYQEKSHEVGVVSQGTKSGERTIAQFLQYKVDFRAFEELGMRDKHQERMKELLTTEKGMLLFCSLPAGGLTTTVTVALRNSDRYMRDFVGVLEKSSKEPHVENVEYTTFDPSKGESPQGRLPSLIRKQPNVLIIFDLPNAETVKILCEAACDDKLIITVIRAKEAVEALLRVLLLKVPAEQFAPAITAVVNQRLVRKLCEACKQAYTPAPELMKKLGIPPGRIESFYRPPENPEEVCPACDGIGYFGRTSVFEFLTVDDEIREALVKQPKLEILRKLARKAGNRTLQEEGLVLVARGDTSLAELKRALDQ